MHRSSDCRSFGGRFRGKNLNFGLVFGAGGVILECFLLSGGAFGSFWAQRQLKDRKPTSSTPPLSKWTSKGSFFGEKSLKKHKKCNQSRGLKIMRKKSGKWSSRGSLDMRSVCAGAYGSHVARFPKKTCKMRKKVPK